ERAVTGIGKRAVRHQYFEKAVALHRQIERIASGRQVALRHQARRSHGLDAEPQLDADREDVALARRLGADLTYVVVQQILKLGRMTLVTGGAQVRDVVGDRLDREFLGGHSGRGGVESEHGLSPRLAHDVGTSASCWMAVLSRSPRL